VTKRPDIINLVRRGADISYLSNDEDEIQGSQNQILEKKNPMLAFLFKVRTQSLAFFSLMNLEMLVHYFA